jgi:hypothetical protein
MNSLSNSLDRQYGKAYREIRDVVNETDPVEIKGRIQLEEEYDPEIAVMLSRVKECRSYDEVLRMVFGIFIRKFDSQVAGAPKKYKPIARKLCDLAGIKEV